MKHNLNKILDECINRLGHGEDIEACLADYPEHTQELEPLLQTMLHARNAYFFTPSTQIKSFHKQRLSSALAIKRKKRENRQPLLTWISGWSKVWAPVAAIIVIAVVVYFGLRPVFTLPVMIAQSNPEGNFVFLLSDEVNDIGDFKELKISVSKVGLHLVGNEEKIIEFEPETQTADLTYLQGNQAQEVWRGNIPQGEYSKVFLEVSEVTGILLESGEEAEIKLPSNRLQVSVPFEIEAGEIVNFVCDLTVVKAGKSDKYILQPQVGQSGANQDFIKVELKELPINNDKSKGNSNAKEPGAKNGDPNQAIDNIIYREELLSGCNMIDLCTKMSYPGIL
jgi:hypothetical protein